MAVYRRIPADKVQEAIYQATHKLTTLSERQIRQLYKVAARELIDAGRNIFSDGTVEFEDYSYYNKLSTFVLEARKIVPDLVQRQSSTIIQVVKDSFTAGHNKLFFAVAEHVKGMTVNPNMQAAGWYMVTNPIKGLSDPRKQGALSNEIVKQITEQVSAGVVSGARYSEVAKRMTQTLDYPYQSAIRTTRTETHRAMESGKYEAMVEFKRKAPAGSVRIEKTWRNAGDNAVRHPKTAKANPANHVAMEGQVRELEELFDLGNGVTATIPSQSGDAGNDINCRCHAEYETKVLANYYTDGANV